MSERVSDGRGVVVQRILGLSATDADWFESACAGVTLAERDDATLAVCQLLDEVNAAPSAKGIIVQTRRGVYLRLALQKDDRVLVKFLGEEGGVKAALTCDPKAAVGEGDERRAGDVMWVRPGAVRDGLPAHVDAAVAAQPIEDLGIRLRALNVLHREGVHTIGELVLRTDARLREMRNLGRVAIEEIDDKLALLGLERVRR